MGSKFRNRVAVRATSVLLSLSLAFVSVPMRPVAWAFDKVAKEGEDVLVAAPEEQPIVISDFQADEEAQDASPVTDADTPVEEIDSTEVADSVEEHIGAEPEESQAGEGVPEEQASTDEALEAPGIASEDSNLSPMSGDEPIASGTDGTCLWIIDQEGGMTIKPMDGEAGALSDRWTEHPSPWRNYSEQIRTISFDGIVEAPTSCFELFAGLPSLTNIDFEGFRTERAISLEQAFSGCSSLTILDLSSWDTSSVTNMAGIFFGCSSLTTLDLSSWDTSSVTDMTGMFFDCRSLVTLNLGTWDTSSVTVFGDMFAACASLTTLDLSGWDTSSATDMLGLFRACTSLTTLDLSGWDTSSVTTMEALFFSCENLTTLDLSSWDNSSVNDSRWMFDNCPYIASITFGEKYSFSEESFPSSAQTWWSTTDRAWYTRKEIISSRSLVADTYLVECPLRDLADATITAPTQVYTGETLTPAIDVVLDGILLVEGEDYTVSYADNVNVGSAIATATGMGNYCGVASAKIVIEPADLSQASVSDVPGQAFSGRALTPTPAVKLGSKTLAKDVDYTLSYDKNTSAGTATVTVTGKGNYKGTVKKTFTIVPADVSKATVDKVADQTWTGKALTPKPAVKIGSTTLKEGTDYTLSYKNNTAVGTATVTVTGRGNYTGTTTTTFKIVAKPHVAYRTHVQNVGWQGYVRDGAMSGTSGRSLRLEGINIKLEGMPYTGSVEYRTHVQNIGWQGYVKDGAMAGTSGRSLRLEGIQIRLTGEMAKHYDIYYRVHCQNLGWMGWARNGAMSGSAGFSYRLEGIEIKLVEKGGKAPGSTSNAFATRTGSQSGVPDAESLVLYRTHVQNVGWQPFMRDGESAGTSGRSLRLEGIEIRLPNAPYSGGIRYATHVQNIGWQGWRSDGAMSGTSGRSLRLEAIRIELTGEMAKHYDVWYRVHAQNFGWMGWAKNGSDAGTAGYSYRLEAIQIRLVPKGGSAPGSTANAFRQKTAPAPAPAPTPGGNSGGSAGGGSVVGDTVLITATGSKYHRLSGCRSTASAHTREVSLSYAQSHGYSPCANCYH